MNKGDVYEDVMLGGFKIGRPARGMVDGAGIDADVCNKAKCESCGHQGMEYHPFIKDEPRSYRAFAICPKCGEAFEF